MRKLLYIYAFVTVFASGQLSRLDEKGELPQFMQDLYEKFAKGKFQQNGRRGNTVRSFLSTVGESFGEQVFVFNISSVPSTEQIVSAEIYFFKRRTHAPFGITSKLTTNGRFALTVQELTNDPLDIEEFEIPESSRGWMSRDISRSVKTVMEKEWPRLLSVKLNEENLNAGLGISSIKSVIKVDPSPFLVLYTNDNTMNVTKFVPHFDPAYGKMKGGKKGRPARSVDDNEIDDVQSEPEMNEAFSETSFDLVAEKKSESVGKIGHKRDSKKSRYIPYPKGHKKSWKLKKDKKKERKLPQAWLDVNQVISNDIPNHISDKPQSKDDLGPCSLKRFVVDTTDLGWSDWMISPRTIEVNYCSGSCLSPTSKDIPTSNHATLQKFLQSLGKYPSIPTPCCVPKSLSSLTLLYFDAKRNVVLKNYPEMSAESCACR